MITTPEFRADAYRFYAELRSNHPVHRVRLANKRDAWLVSRYADVLALLKDQRLAKDPLNAGINQPWMPASMKALSRNMLDLDPPDHTRLRVLVHKAFTPKRVEELRARVERLSTELLERSKLTPNIDIVRDYALPIPTTIIAEVLGIPVADRHKFHRWSAAIVSVDLSKWSMLKAIPNGLAFIRYIRKLVREKRSHPTDDLLGGLVGAEEAGDQLTEDELVAMVFLLLVAGHETTVNLIANGLLALLEHPEELQRLRDKPDLIKPAVEEMLRYYSPVELSTERYARAAIEMHGVEIPRGGLVYGVLSSANRDEEQFANADRFDIAREPNRHLAFGQGIHFCVGAPLARMEAQIAIDALLHQTREIRLNAKRSELQWRPGLNLRGLRRLPVTLVR